MRRATFFAASSVARWRNNSRRETRTSNNRVRSVVKSNEQTYRTYGDKRQRNLRLSNLEAASAAYDTQKLRNVHELQSRTEYSMDTVA